MSDMVKSKAGWLIVLSVFANILLALIGFWAAEMRGDVREIKHHQHQLELRLKSDAHRLQVLESLGLDHESRLRALERPQR